MNTHELVIATDVAGPWPSPVIEPMSREMVYDRQSGRLTAKPAVVNKDTTFIVDPPTSAEFFLCLIRRKGWRDPNMLLKWSLPRPSPFYQLVQKYGIWWIGFIDWFANHNPAIVDGSIVTVVLQNSLRFNEFAMVDR